MSASNSVSNTPTNTNTTSTNLQGGSGAGSSTVAAGGNVSVNDPTLQLGTVQALANTVMAALTGGGSLVGQALNLAQQNSTQQANQSAAQSSDESQILSEALASQSALASAQGTGGASLTSQSTNYLIWGAIALGAIALFAFFDRK